MCFSTPMEIQGKLIHVLYIKDYLFNVPLKARVSTHMCTMLRIDLILLIGAVTRRDDILNVIPSLVLCYCNLSC